MEILRRIRNTFKVLAIGNFMFFFMIFAGLVSFFTALWEIITLRGVKKGLKAAYGSLYGIVWCFIMYIPLAIMGIAGCWITERDPGQSTPSQFKPRMKRTEPFE